jgi:hypothetical protein
VVSHQTDRRLGSAIVDEPVEHTLGIGTAVDVIPRKTRIVFDAGCIAMSASIRAMTSSRRSLGDHGYPRQHKFRLPSGAPARGTLMREVRGDQVTSSAFWRILSSCFRLSCRSAALRKPISRNRRRTGRPFARELLQSAGAKGINSTAILVAFPRITGIASDQAHHQFPR